MQWHSFPCSFSTQKLSYSRTTVLQLKKKTWGLFKVWFPAPINQPGPTPCEKSSTCRILLFSYAWLQEIARNRLLNIDDPAENKSLHPRGAPGGQTDHAEFSPKPHLLAKWQLASFCYGLFFPGPRHHKYLKLADLCSFLGETHQPSLYK